MIVHYLNKAVDLGDLCERLNEVKYFCFEHNLKFDYLVKKEDIKQFGGGNPEDITFTCQDIWSWDWDECLVKDKEDGTFYLAPRCEPIGCDGFIFFGG